MNSKHLLANAKWKSRSLTLRLLAIATVTSLLFLNACKKHEVQTDGANTARWTSSEVAAADSVQGQLQSQGKQWARTTGEITVGAYVQDLLEGRLDQPKGRGAIGKVVSISTGDNNAKVAVVDFGRGYSVGISLSELTLVNVTSK